MPTIANRLAEVARQHLRMGTLDERRSDGLDFHTVSVWEVKDALQAAYEIGQEQARCPKETVLLDALDQVQDQLRGILAAESLGTPYTREEILTWLGELSETASKVILAAKGNDR